MREKKYSLEEDLALDERRCRDKMPSYYQILIKRIEEYDPEGKKAHAIAEKIRREAD